MQPSSDKVKNELIKDVSAFANSAGGTIVYGIIEKGHLPEAIDTGFDPNVVTREWLEQVINTIQRRIDGIRINQVELNNTRPGKVLYVVYIPQSYRAPHMANDHRFYKRFNFESRPIEEYEVRDVACRGETPDLRISFSFFGGEEMPLKFQYGESYSVPIDFAVSLTNDAPMPTEYILIRLFIDKQVQIDSHADLLVANDRFLEVGHQRVSTKVLYLNWGVPGKMPVWEGVWFSVTDKPLKISFPKQAGVYMLGWEVQSPRMLPKSRFYFLRSSIVSEIDGSVSISDYMYEVLVK